MMVNFNPVDDNLPQELAFTEEQLEEPERAGSMPITFEEDCPETTPELALRFHRVNPIRRIAQESPFPGSGIS